MAKRSTSERALIDTGRNKMSAKREAKDQFKEMDDVRRSPAADCPQDGQDGFEIRAWGPRGSSRAAIREAVASPVTR